MLSSLFESKYYQVLILKHRQVVTKKPGFNQKNQKNQNCSKIPKVLEKMNKVMLFISNEASFCPKTDG